MTEEKMLYEDPPMDEEEVGMSLVPIQQTSLIPIDVDGSIKAWHEYLRLCREILDDTDHATIRGIKARKRSGWAKLRRFYNISTRIVREQRTPPLDAWEPDQAFLYIFTVEGRLGTRVEIADGTCESTELEGSNIAPTEHNVRAKALTRAKNRVTSDLIGGGEVSAEELETGEPQRQKRTAKKPWTLMVTPCKKFWAWAQESMGLADNDVFEALGVENLQEYTGSMKEAKTAIEEWLADQVTEEDQE